MDSYLFYPVLFESAGKQNDYFFFSAVGVEEGGTGKCEEQSISSRVKRALNELLTAWNGPRDLLILYRGGHAEAKS